MPRRSDLFDSDGSISPDSPDSPTALYKSKKYEAKSRTVKTPAKAPVKSKKKIRYSPSEYSVSSSVYPGSEIAPKIPRAERQREKSESPTRERKSGRERERERERRRDREQDRERSGRSKSARTPTTPYSPESPPTPVKKKKKSSSSKRRDEPESPHVRIVTPAKSPRRKKEESRYDGSYNSAADYMTSGASAEVMPPTSKRDKSQYLKPIRTQPVTSQQQRQMPPGYSPRPARPSMPTQESVLHMSNGQPSNQRYGPPQQDPKFFQQETRYYPGPYVASPGPYTPGPAQTNVSGNNNMLNPAAPYVDPNKQGKGWFGGAVKNPFDDSNQYGQLPPYDPFAQTEQGMSEKLPEKKPRKKFLEWWADFKHKKLVLWAIAALLGAVVLAVGLYIAITKSTAHKKAGTSVTGGATNAQVTTNNQASANKVSGQVTEQAVNNAIATSYAWGTLDPSVINAISPPVTAAAKARRDDMDQAVSAPEPTPTLVPTSGASVAKRAAKRKPFQAFRRSVEESAAPGEPFEEDAKRSVEAGRYHISPRAPRHVDPAPGVDPTTQRDGDAAAPHKRHESRHTAKATQEVRKRTLSETLADHAAAAQSAAAKRDISTVIETTTSPSDEASVKRDDETTVEEQVSDHGLVDRDADKPAPFQAYRRDADAGDKPAPFQAYRRDIEAADKPAPFQAFRRDAEAGDKPAPFQAYRRDAEAGDKSAPFQAY